MTYHHRDADGERLDVEADSFEDGSPAVYFDTTAPIRIHPDRVEELIAGIRDTARQACAPDGPPPAAAVDTCRAVEIDGAPVLVRGTGELDSRDEELLTEVVHAAKAMFLTEQAAIVQRIVSLYRTWLAQGAPPLGTSVSRWWDSRLRELHVALSHHIGAGGHPYDNPLLAREKWALSLVGILSDLDRCQHGRHEGDPCGSCGGLSTGNPYLGPGRVIGHGVCGRPIVLPIRDHKTNPAAWRATTTKDNT